MKTNIKYLMSKILFEECEYGSIEYEILLDAINKMVDNEQKIKEMEND